MPKSTEGSTQGYQWAAVGDINAFFGLMLDNIADLVLAVSLLSIAYGFPVEFALRYMVPGTALGVVFGDVVYTGLAIWVARKTGKNTITAMPLGLDTPSTFGMVFFVLGPAYSAAIKVGNPPEAAAMYAWHIGICAIVASGIFKLACAFASGWIRRIVPRAGLLGSLTAIALVLISFLPLLEVLHQPVVGLISLTIILTTLVARVPVPGRVPGALAALMVGGTLYYGMQFAGLIPVPEHALIERVWLPTEWMSAWQFEWLAVWKDALQYMPVVIPFALATVVGGIDCTESASAAGDEYHTPTIIAVEGMATLVAGLCGGVIQTTPYIGHPAYKAMGGRAAYTLATAVFVGTAGVLGYFSILYEWIPKPAIFPILIFIGLEITAQSFDATPRKHFPAVAFACVPALAYLVSLMTGSLLSELNGNIADLSPTLAEQLYTSRIISNGFIVTSLLWGGWLASIIDHRLHVAAGFALVASFFSFFGVIHSPTLGAPLALPWDMPKELSLELAMTPYLMSAAYGIVAIMLFAWHAWMTSEGHAPKRPTADTSGKDRDKPRSGEPVVRDPKRGVS
jgi:AGZA family xanthine/uracil permease-like MFS transporter